ncbi:hypothetical protein [Chromatocurvus halotolerans]|uniref:hypothetical protein n=1 Tax=Chromatocurvus halotolerans TaxID=1132028 RepID=UPI001052A29E|nr:hypothetical protein [Chromatocurvus halotolerans]
MDDNDLSNENRLCCQGDTDAYYPIPESVLRQSPPTTQNWNNDFSGSTRRDTFYPAFDNKEKRDHTEGHARYYDEMNWIFALLASWLQARK